MILHYKDGLSKTFQNASLEELTKWINESESKSERFARKAICYARLYSAGTQKLGGIFPKGKSWN